MMRPWLEDRLLRRELGSSTSRYSRIRGIYGDRKFIHDLDIVNELNGHSGCINALSWSRSGSLLASGSDDTMVNIYSYHPETSLNQFDLATTIDTGHTRNIFSVKFMPHSNDRTVITAAGDGQIRVFDIERASVNAGARQYLSTGSANGKVFRSHNGAVKRIVTEASPFYFLSCAEDGDVRQWDIRQPESTYPSSHRNPMRDEAPPALISYKDYNVDLYTISCSPSQPHYIALGGTHMHCFLHDRRMLGRDKLRERGGLPNARNSSDDSALEAATRCVRKFAPHGQPAMGRSDSKTITACKISDSNPNELIASWSSDFIYSFNILREDETPKPGAEIGTTQANDYGRIHQDRDRKRKRPRVGSQGLSHEGEARAGSHARASSIESESRLRPQELSILFRMENGQSVEIPIPTGVVEESQMIGSNSEPLDNNGIAAQVRGVRRSMFEFTRSNRLDPSSSTVRQDESGELHQRMEQTLVSALRVLENIDSIMHNWSYPVTESSGAIAFQRKLRDDRAKTWRFVQACGTIARVISQRPSNTGPRRVLEFFDIIRPAPREPGLQLEGHEQFGYDFIKTILLWLDSGIGAVIREFTCDPDDPARSYSKRLPISKDSGIVGIENELIPYLTALGTELTLEDDDIPRAENHTLFRSEKEAVNALTLAMRVPFADLAGHAAETNSEGRILAQDRETAVKFWGQRVCRAVLRNAAIDVNFALVDTAFGEYTASPEDIRGGRLDDVVAEDEAEEAEEAEEDYDDGDESSEGSSYYTSDDDDVTAADIGQPRFRSKILAGRGVPCLPHHRQYQGHCNTQTTKDVNFFGLQDEYVVSGSDCGNLFIWDRQTTQLLNILEGDNDVVNVIQGHPYEPVLAVSGIDSTVKIFSADSRARWNAARGNGIEEGGHSTFSGIGLRRHRPRRHPQAPPNPREAHHSMPPFDPEDYSPSRSDSEAHPDLVTSTGNTQTAESPDSLSPQEEDSRMPGRNALASRKRMHNEYQIVSQNDMDRRRGGRAESSFLSRGMMALLAQRFRAEVQDVAIDDLIGEEGEMEEGCRVM